MRFRAALLLGLGIAFGQDTAAFGGRLGNTLNPSAADYAAAFDPRGLSSFRQTPSRTPSGFLHAWPRAPSEGLGIDGLGRILGSLEFGVLETDDDERAERFLQYSDWDAGPLLNALSLDWLNTGASRYLKLSALGAGRDDQAWRAELGEYGRFRLGGFYNETPHVFTTNAVSPYQGIGGSLLKLQPGIAPRPFAPPAGDNSALAGALAGAAARTLALSREQSGVAFEWLLGRSGRIFARYGHEAREGSRPFGGTFGAEFYNPLGGAVETVEPVDFATHDVTAGTYLSLGGTQINLVYAGSWFYNDQNALVFDNPFVLAPEPPGGGIAARRALQGRSALAPDNDSQQVKLDFARRLPFDLQLTGSGSWTRMRQNDALLPQTITDNAPALPDPIDWSLYRTTDALSRARADAEIEQLRGHLQLDARAGRRLRLNASVTRFDEDNDTAYTAINPLTGEYGYVIEDGAYPLGLGLYAPGGTSRVRYRSTPFARSELDWRFGAIWRALDRTNVQLAFSREEIERDHRERDRTLEDRISLNASDRHFSRATLRLTAELAERDGDAYVQEPLEEFFTSSLPGFPAGGFGARPVALADLRKFDLADRDQRKIDGQVNILARNDLDLAVSGQWLDNDYGARFGRLDDQLASIGAELNYQPAPAFNAYLFVQHQRYEQRQRGATYSGGADPAAGGASFPAGAFWSEETDGRSQAIGAGLKLSHRVFSLRSDFSHLSSTDDLSYRYASPSALAASIGGMADAAQAGAAFPSVRFDRNIWETDLEWTVNPRVSLRFYHRYEQARTRDWRYDGLAPLVNNTLFLAAIPQDYSVNVFGVFLRVNAASAEN
jgi:MtrB/PioB family decaheme-associated outer membrane protein